MQRHLCASTENPGHFSNQMETIVLTCINLGPKLAFLSLKRERAGEGGGEGNLVSRALISKEKAISFPEPKCHTWAPETRLRKKPWGTRLGGNISRAHPELKGKLFLLILNTTNLGFKIFIPTLKLGMYNKV